MRKQDKTAVICFAAAAVSFYVCAVINFAEREAGLGAMYLCLGSSNLCLSSVHLSKSNKNIIKISNIQI